MARCKKCNAKIPEGKELCAECEQQNSESYLNSLLRTVASEDQITQEAENARKLRSQKMREKIARGRKDLPRDEVQEDLSKKEISGTASEAEPVAGREPGTEQVPDRKEVSEPKPAAEEFEEKLSEEKLTDGEFLESEPTSKDSGEGLEVGQLLDGNFSVPEPPSEEVPKSGQTSVRESFEAESTPTEGLFDKQRFNEEFSELEPVFEGAPETEQTVDEAFADEDFTDGNLSEAEPTSQTSGETEEAEEAPETEQTREADQAMDKSSAPAQLPEEEAPSRPDILEEDFLPEENIAESPDTEFTQEIPEGTDAESGAEALQEEADLYREKEILPERQELEDMPRKEKEIPLSDFAEGNKEYEDDKYMMTPEEEAAFEIDMPDDLFGESSFDDGNYDIFGDDMLSDGEFDGMLQEIADTEKVPDMPKETAPNPMEAADEAAAGAEDGAVAVNAGREDVLSDQKATEEMAGKIEAPEMNDLPEIMGERESSMTTAANELENEEFNGEAETQEDILDLINSLYSSQEEEPLSQTEDTAPGEQYGTEDDLEMSGKQDDFSDMLSDVLPDGDLASIQDINMMDGEEEDAAGKKQKKKKKKKKDKTKPSIWKRLFGNVKTERSEEEIAQMKEKVIADAEAKEAAKEEKIKKAAEAKEEKKKKAAEDKAAAAKKKQENEKKKAEKKAEAAKAKQEAKDKKKQEVQNLIDAIDENEGRINRVGASIVFVFFALLAVAILVGTYTYAYVQGIQNARESFEFDHYNDAYEEIAGLDVMREEDETFVLQVMVVMYTYKQLNSFHNYYEAGLYPEALDSLLKGLKRYDKYSSIATVIRIEEDMDIVRGEILQELEDVYSLTEQDAVALMAIRDQEAYSRQVYEIAGRID